MAPVGRLLSHLSGAPSCCPSLSQLFLCRRGWTAAALPPPVLAVGLCVSSHGRYSRALRDFLFLRVSVRALQPGRLPGAFLFVCGFVPAAGLLAVGFAFVSEDVFALLSFLGQVLLVVSVAGGCWLSALWDPREGVLLAPGACWRLSAFADTGPCGHLPHFLLPRSHLLSPWTLVVGCRAPRAIDDDLISRCVTQIHDPFPTSGDVCRFQGCDVW